MSAIACAALVFFSGFCAGTAVEQWKNKRISKSIPDDPWALHKVRPEISKLE